MTKTTSCHDWHNDSVTDSRLHFEQERPAGGASLEPLEPPRASTKRPAGKGISEEEIHAHFQYPMVEAAQRLGVSETTLRKNCRSESFLQSQMRTCDVGVLTAPVKEKILVMYEQDLCPITPLNLYCCSYTSLSFCIKQLILPGLDTSFQVQAKKAIVWIRLDQMRWRWRED